MKVHPNKPGLFLMSLVVSLLVGAALSSAASANPTWKLNGATLVGSEEILGHAVESSLTTSILTTTCKPFVYGMTIFNTAGTGEGSVTEVLSKTASQKTKRAC